MERLVSLYWYLSLSKNGFLAFVNKSYAHVQRLRQMLLESGQNEGFASHQDGLVTWQDIKKGKQKLQDDVWTLTLSLKWKSLILRSLQPAEKWKVLPIILRGIKITLSISAAFLVIIESA